jgi:hypothetical protein
MIGLKTAFFLVSTATGAAGIYLIYRYSRLSPGPVEPRGRDEGPELPPDDRDRLSRIGQGLAAVGLFLQAVIHFLPE